MADPIQTPAGEQPQAGSQTPVGPAGEQPQPESQERFDATKAIETMTEADLHRSLFETRESIPKEPQPAQNVPQETERQNTPVENEKPSDGEQPPETASSTEENSHREPNAQGPDRVSLRSLPPAERKLVAEAVSLLRDGKVASMADALKQLTQPGESGAPQEQQPQPSSQPQTQPEPKTEVTPTKAPVTADSDVARITAVLADLREQRDEAVRSYDRPKELELTRSIEDTVGELSEARATARIRAQQQETKTALVNSAVEETYLKHPESENPKSFFSYRLAQELDSYEARYGPISENPSQLMVLADKVASEIGPAPKGETQQRVIQQPVPPKQESRPLGIGAQGHASPPRPTREQSLRQVDSASEDELRAALWNM